ncbi:hypothetical protein U1Q18_013239 [Sarracenia purpurea var. burkii]
MGPFDGEAVVVAERHLGLGNPKRAGMELGGNLDAIVDDGSDHSSEFRFSVDWYLTSLIRPVSGKGRGSGRRESAREEGGGSVLAQAASLSDGGYNCKFKARLPLAERKQ